MSSFFLELYLSLFFYYKYTDHGSLTNGTIFLLAAILAIYSMTESESLWPLVVSSVSGLTLSAFDGV